MNMKLVKLVSKNQKKRACLAPCQDPDEENQNRHEATNHTTSEATCTTDPGGNTGGTCSNGGTCSSLIVEGDGTTVATDRAISTSSDSNRRGLTPGPQRQGPGAWHVFPPTNLTRATNADPDPELTTTHGNAHGNGGGDDGDDVVHIGMVYVFRRDATSNSWKEEALILPPQDAQDDDASMATFGSQIAVSGDTIIVASPKSNNGRGAVYIFTRAGTGNTVS